MTDLHLIGHVLNSLNPLLVWIVVFLIFRNIKRLNHANERQNDCIEMQQTVHKCQQQINRTQQDLNDNLSASIHTLEKKL